MTLKYLKISLYNLYITDSNIHRGYCNSSMRALRTSVSGWAQIDFGSIRRRPNWCGSDRPSCLTGSPPKMPWCSARALPSRTQLVTSASSLTVSCRWRRTSHLSVDLAIISCASFDRWTVVRSLSVHATKTLVQAFISCRLDYCNSLLYGISDGLLRRVQSIENAAARLVTGARRCVHITPVM